MGLFQSESVSAERTVLLAAPSLLIVFLLSVNPEREKLSQLRRLEDSQCVCVCN